MTPCPKRELLDKFLFGPTEPECEFQREGKTISETALAVGYESASGFGTAFSRKTGRAPSEFAGAHRMSAWRPRNVPPRLDMPKLGSLRDASYLAM